MKTVQTNNIDQIWQYFFETHEEEYRNLLMENYLRLVKYTADRIYVKLPDKVEVDDLVSAGIFGLMDAIDAFDPERGVKFETYCAPRIRGAILDELRSMDWVPRLVRSRSNLLDNTFQTLEAHLGRIPTDNEIAKELQLNETALSRLQRDANAIGLVSLDNFSDSEGDSDTFDTDLIKDQKSKNPFNEAHKSDLKYWLAKHLSRTERLIVLLYYFKGISMKEIAMKLDLTESRISQMHSSILYRLRSKIDL